LSCSTPRWATFSRHGLLESAALQTAEAALTGESLPVSKDTEVVAGEVALGDRHNMVFSGTAATYGHGKAVVTATGMQTEMGRIAGLLKETPDEATPLQRELDRTGKLLGLVVIAVAVVMIATIISQHRWRTVVWSSRWVLHPKEPQLPAPLRACAALSLSIRHRMVLESLETHHRSPGALCGPLQGQ
jgi:E1-E2 ATPase